MHRLLHISHSVGRNRRILRASFLTALLSVFGACVTTPKSKTAAGEDSLLDYKLENGVKITAKKPLPDVIPVIVESHFASGKVERRVAFYGSDFNGDGRFDMIEALDKDGHVQSVAYDFDFDGKIDAQEHADLNTVEGIELSSAMAKLGLKKDTNPAGNIAPLGRESDRTEMAH